MEEKYLQLIHQELDGANSPDERAELEAYLATHPEARKVYEEMIALSEKLKQVPMTEPPANLTYRVMAEIASAQPRTRTSTAGSWLTTILNDFRTWKWRYALSFSAGLAMGFVVLFIVMEKTGDASFLRGVMGLKNDVSGFTVTDEAHITLEKASGHVRMETSADFLRVDMRLHAGRALEFRIEYDSSALSFVGLRMTEGEDAGLFQIQSGELRVAHEGDRRYSLIWQRRTASALPLHLRIFEGQALLYEGVLQTGRIR
jgi:hypothetical protein